MKRAFTLIELLIVVAIIAILAAIAVPNFLEAQIRAKVSRMKNDMRSLATGLESYQVDNNNYPYGFATGPNVPRYGLSLLSTPIAYISSPLLRDVFISNQSGFLITGSGTQIASTDPNDFAVQYSGRGRNSSGQIDAGLGVSATFPSKIQWWLLRSFGPDGDADAYSNQIRDNQVDQVVNAIYDPTNGTVSNGNIYRVGGAPLRQAGQTLMSMSNR